MLSHTSLLIALHRLFTFFNHRASSLVILTVQRSSGLFPFFEYAATSVKFQPMLQAVVAPLNEFINRKLLLTLKDLLKASKNNEGFASGIHSATSDAEFNMLLDGLEQLVLLSLTCMSDVNIMEYDTSINAEKTTEGSGLLGYVSNVFTRTLQTIPNS
ncbi:hypothetical protein F5880DRAFT_1643513 [Lentinula raphanica]|nr:hypothetical protein F5880DRAFT_1643513 [Lentinula raphanica]